MLDEQELGDYIDRHFTSSLFRLETLDYYAVASDGDEYQRYLAGETTPNPEHMKPWMEHIRQEVARGLHTYRVHVVRSPLSDYLRFETPSRTPETRRRCLPPCSDTVSC